MLSRLTVLSTISVLALAACATNQENPYYKYSSQYEGAPITQVAHAPDITQLSTVSYQAEPAEHDALAVDNMQQATYTRVDHECLKKEKNHELLGAGIGGAIGAVAGKSLIGGTEGTVIGAGLGGAVGYGVGDKVVNCDPETFVMIENKPVASTVYVASTQPAKTQAEPKIATPYVSPTDTEFDTISTTGTPGYQVLQAQTDVSSLTAPVTAIGSTAREVVYDYSANTVASSATTETASPETRYLGMGARSHVVKQGDTVYSLSRKLCVSVSDIQSLNGLNSNFGINIGDQLKLPPSRC